MTKTPNPEEAMERARRTQEDKLESIRNVAETRQRLTNVQDETKRELTKLQQQVKERISAAEVADISAYNAAVRAGWSVDELRKIGFSEPAKKARTRRRSTQKTATKPSLQNKSPQAQATHVHEAHNVDLQEPKEQHIVE